MKLRDGATGWVAAVLLFLLLLLSVWNASAVAATPDAEKLIREGVELRRGGDDAAAVERFQRAFDLAPSPRATAQLGLAEQALGRWVVAYEHLHRALDAGNDPWIKKSRAALNEALSHVNDHVGQLEILGGAPGAEVRIDGSPRGKLPLKRPLVVSTGTVAIDLVAPGYASIQRTTIVHARESVRESFDAPGRAPARDDAAGSGAAAGAVRAAAVVSGPRRAPAEGALVNPALSASAADSANGISTPGQSAALTDVEKESRDEDAGDSGSKGGGSSFRPKAKWVAWGIGAGALAVGAFGWVRQDQAGNDFEANCGIDPAHNIVPKPPSSKSAADCRDLKTKVDSNYRIEVIGLVGAAVLLAGGLALWLTEPSSPPPAAAAETTAALSCAPELTTALLPRMTCRLRF